MKEDNYEMMQSLIRDNPLGKDDYSNELWADYIEVKNDLIAEIDKANCLASLVSERNWARRCMYNDGEEMGIIVKEGDICYIDYGQVYRNETGYQHFGLVLNIFARKAMVIPMTSNEQTYRNAYDPVDNPNGKRHLMRLGMIAGMAKPSVMFLNDIKYVNTARIIDIKARLSTESQLYWDIKRRVLCTSFGKPDMAF